MGDDDRDGGFEYRYGFIDDGVIFISLEGFEVLRVEFNAENFERGLYERLQSTTFAHLSEERRRRVADAVRGRFAEEGIEVDDEQLVKWEGQAAREIELRLIKDSLTPARSEAEGKILELVCGFWEKLLDLATYAGANALRDAINLPELKYSGKVIEEALQKIERERLRTLISEPITRGGAHNVKHLWTDEERACLAAKYKELRPVWVEAKRIARAAQKSQERTRRREWRKEVLRAYPNLPTDLLERFASPRAEDAKPADIAVIHAKRECGVKDEYSSRHLRDQIKAWKLKNSP